MDPFDHFRRGDVECFKRVELDVLQNSRDENSDTLISMAAILNQLECCREVYRRCPSLLWHQNRFLNSALHHAIFYGASMSLIEFLIDCALTTANEADLEKGKKWLAIQNYEGDTSLLYAVIKRSVEITQMLMDKDPNHELSMIANFKRNTPLHMAVGYQHIEQVRTLAIPEPDFEYSLNSDGETPLLIAMRKDVSGDVTAVRIKWMLLEKQPNQCKAKTGERGWTALHHVASKGDEVMIEDIFQFCPECTDILDNDGHNFLHTAAKYEQVGLVKNILETKDISPTLLNGQDNYGNTPLHLAAEVGNKSTVLCFLYDSRVNKHSVNAKSKRVLDAITFDYDTEKAGVYGVRDRVNEQELKNQSDFDLVVGALIATVSFTAGITVPGGYKSDGDNQGMAVGSGQSSLLEVSCDVRLQNWNPCSATRQGRLLCCLVPFAIFWTTWKERNERCFEEKCSSLQQLIKGVKACVWGWTMELPMMKGLRFDKVLSNWDSL